MLAQLIIGSMVIVATVAIQAEMFGLMTRRHEPVLTWTRHRFRRMAGTVFISIAMLMVLATMTIEVWLWALVLIVTGAVAGLEPSISRWSALPRWALRHCRSLLSALIGGLFLVAGLLHHAGLWRHHPAQ
jgi:hypothetical protein